MARLPLRSLRVMVYAPGSTRASWIQSELSNTDVDAQVAHDVRGVYAALLDAPLPRPAVLILDFEHMLPIEILELHGLRERGWCGLVIGLGRVPNPLRTSLGVERVVPIASNTLAAEIGNLGFTDQTIRIPLRVRAAPVIGRAR